MAVFVNKSFSVRRKLFLFSKMSAVTKTSSLSFSLVDDQMQSAEVFLKSEEDTQDAHENVLRLWNKYKQNPTSMSSPRSSDSSKPSLVVENAVAVHSFKETGEHFLNFSANDVVTVLYEKEGWGYGESNGRRGYFPKSYVEPLFASSLPGLPEKEDWKVLLEHVSLKVYKLFFTILYPLITFNWKDFHQGTSDCGTKSATQQHCSYSEWNL